MNKKMLVMALGAITMVTAAQAQSVTYGTDEKDYVAGIGENVPNNHVSAALDDEPKGNARYHLSSLGDNWFAGVTGGTAMFLGQPKGCSDFFKRQRPAFTAFIGKWHSPFFGTRIIYEGFKLSDAAGISTGYDNIHGDLMLNLASFYHRSYFPTTQKWDFSPYVGGGVWYNHITKRSPFAVSYGFLTSYRITERFHALLDIGGSTTTQTWDNLGKHGHTGDNIFHATIGISYTIGGKGWKAKKQNTSKMITTGEDEDTEPIPFPNNNYSGLNSLRNRLSGQPTETTEEKSYNINAPVLFFFKKNTCKLIDPQQLHNIAEIAAAAKEYGLKLKIVGAADSKTGSKRHNRNLSVRRCKYIAKLLMKAGVPKDRMSGVSEGGINIYHPYPANRHTCVIMYKD
ncbi:MAG: OmpA family protein [Prevotellaceae bacterium]|nr:OmpA family protein [Prevotellaceae bacterium]